MNPSPPDVWYVIPSAKEPGASSTISLWRKQGYKVAVYRDTGMATLPEAHLNVFGAYKGYPAAVNSLVRSVLIDEGVQWVVTGGDDIEPDAQAPADIAAACTHHFSGTFGVMQPTGDRWMVDAYGRAAAERVCESPWMGREWCRRAYGGRGPLPEEYFHFFEDEELHEVALKLGVLWHRRDLSHVHHHWSREKKPRPNYLHPARLDWDMAKAIFQDRKKAGFPGHEPLRETTI
jgi:hypothetical protein